MKTKYIFLSFVACICCMYLLESCDESDFQKSVNSINEPAQIQVRSGCVACPDPLCCCYVKLNGDNSATLVFCGTADGSYSCSASPVCLGVYAPTGMGDTFFLTGGNPREPFCMGEGYGLQIHNITANDTANVIISCQGDLTDPQEVPIQILPGHRIFYKTNGSCEVLACP